MSEEIDGQQAGGEQEPAAEFKPITSQDELEKVLGKRLERERAKFADYDDLKAKASKWAEVEESQKSEVQKALERAEAAEKRASELERTTLRRSIADELGVPVEAVHGDDADSMRASAEAVKQWAEQGRRKAPTPPSLLKSGSAGGDDSSLSGKERAASALRRMRGVN